MYNINGDVMKKIIKFTLYVGIIYAIYFYRYNIINFALNTYVNFTRDEIKTNEYTKNIDYLSFKRTDNFNPTNKEDLINIIYTILDDGIEDFIFVCDYKYIECESDFKEIVNSETLQVINNYVHPFNSYNTFNYISNMGLIHITINKSYTSNEIAEINNKLNIIINTIDSNLNDYDKIKLFHDYIVNNTKYDENEASFINNKDNNITIKTPKAYGVLINGYGVCSGYADAMALYLSKIGINNFKVGNDEHIWNALYLEDIIYNIDATWDDPITSNGSDILLYDYFMISTSELISKDQTKHTYNSDLYLELS